MSIVLDGRIFVEHIAPPPPVVPLWRLGAAKNPREAAQTLGSAPDVFVLSAGEGRVKLTSEWQRFFIELNPGMTLGNISGLLGNHKAFTNGTGFATEPDDPPRANFILGQNIAAPLPEFDKDRSCSFACHTGVIEGEFLKLTTLNGNNPPPSITDINPASHPWFFFHATLVYKDGAVQAFPGAAPGWGIARNCVWIPLVTTHPVYVPLTMTTKVDRYLLPYS